MPKKGKDKGCGWEIGALILVILFLLLACASSDIDFFIPETWFATATPTP